MGLSLTHANNIPQQVVADAMHSFLRIYALQTCLTHRASMLETRGQQQAHIQAITLHTLAILPVRCSSILTAISALSALTTSASHGSQVPCANQIPLYLGEHTLSSPTNVSSSRPPANETLAFSGEHNRVLSAAVTSTRTIANTLC